MKIYRGTFSELGFSLVEMLVAVGILSVIAVGTSMQLLQIHNNQLQAQSKASVVETQALIHKMFGKTSSRSSWSCAQAVVPTTTGNTFNTGGRTDIQVIPRNGASAAETYQAGNTVSGAGKFTINALYLDDVTQVASMGNTYLANMYMVSDTGTSILPNLTKPRNIGTFVVQIDPSSRRIVACNFDTGVITPAQECGEIAGMRWSTVTNSCVSAVDVQSNSDTTACPPATQRNASGVCVPEPSSCANGQLASGFSAAIVRGCTQPPLNPSVGQPSVPVPPAQYNQPNTAPVAAATPSQPYVPATSGTPIPSTVPAATPLPSGCSSSYAVALADYNTCQNNAPSSANTCSTAFSAPPSTLVSNCVQRTGQAYQPPPPASTPSPAPPPADTSCQCGTGRIADQAYCTYCIPNVNLGYGAVDYAYGSNKCNAGVLVPDNSISFDPTVECSGGYAPTRASGSRFVQRTGFRTAIP